jgi:hypothetical protein
MRKKIFLAALGFLFVAGMTSYAADSVAEDKSGGAYPNDFGPTTIDVSSYTEAMQGAYKIFVAGCAACHTIARPINSQFLELTDDEVAAAKKADPDFGKDDSKILQAEDKVWGRYVHRMMAKPGCPIKGADGKKVWEFLVYDSKIRKMGANRKVWVAQRQKLVDDFKKSNPEIYAKLFGADAAPAPSGK